MALSIFICMVTSCHSCILRSAIISGEMAKRSIRKRFVVQKRRSRPVEVKEESKVSCRCICVIRNYGCCARCFELIIFSLAGFL